MPMPKLRMHALYNNGFPLSELERDVGAFFAAGATQSDLVRHMNAEYRTANKLLSAAIRNGRAAPIIAAWKDFTDCIIPVAALLAEGGHVESLRAAIANGAEVDMADDQGSAIVRAGVRAAQAYAEAVGSGTKPSATPDVQSADKMLRMLIKAGADVNATTKTGDNALMAVARAGDEKSVKLLLDAGARVMDRNADGVTPLHCAMLCPPDALEGVPDGKSLASVVKRLLDAGADANAKTYQGDAPLHLLTAKNLTASRETVVHVGKMLLRAGAKLELRNRVGNTPLLAAVSSGRQTTCAVEALLELGANPEIRSYLGWTIQQSGSAHVRGFLKIRLASPSAPPDQQSAA